MIALDELKKLPVEEKLELVTVLWELIAEDGGQGLEEELKKRLAEYEEDPSSAVSWDEVRAELLGDRA